MQYQANSLPLDNVAENYIEPHVNFDTLLISQDNTFITNIQSMKRIEQIFHNWDLISNVNL